ncbi:hypothetical protein [Hymenobacter fastidiosus]|uniref:hypothetical protein n=1 Tax=Hymenobacter fastidiosus TaxID=486264 RepID=UPI0031EEFB7C
MSETTLSGSLPCLASLAGVGVATVTLRAAYLTWRPEPGNGIGRGTPTLAALASGTCFLTANSRKTAVASFTSRTVHTTRIDMEVQGRPNLLDCLRADHFTLEISGVNRRRLTRPLAFSAGLEFDVQMIQGATA